MDLLNIIIDNQKYDYVDSIRIDDKCYIAYGDGNNIYICGFDPDNNTTYVISNKEYQEVKKRMNLDGK